MGGFERVHNEPLLERDKDKLLVIDHYAAGMFKGADSRCEGEDVFRERAAKTADGKTIR